MDDSFLHNEEAADITVKIASIESVTKMSSSLRPES